MQRVGYSLFAMAGLLSCGGDGSTPEETPGELGNGVFSYQCVDDTDPMCPTGGRATDFPELIGVDGIFDVEFDPSSGEDQSAARIQPAADGIVEEQDDLFFAQAPGTVALLAKRTSDGRIVDFIHVDVREIADLDIRSSGSSPSTVWQTGVRDRLTVVPRDVTRATLAGAREFVWETSDDSIVRLERANPTAIMEVYPLSPGTVTITVSAAGITSELSITVEGDAVPADGGTDAPNDGGAHDDAADGASEADGGAGDGSPDGADDAAILDGGPG